MPVLLLLLTMLAAPADGPDAREIMRRATERNERILKLARQYTFVQRSEERTLDSKGNVTSRESETWDVTLLEGAPYSRLIAKNDKPLSAKDEKKEQERLDKSMKEDEKERAKRRAKTEKRREEGRKFMLEIQDAYNFRRLPDETLDGRALFVLDATPRTGFKPKTTEGGMLPKMRGKLWIDQEEFTWVKAEVEVIDTISLGLFLVRINKDMRMSFTSTRVNEELWMPKSAVLRGSARLALLKKINGEYETTWRDYKRFQTETKILAIEPVKQ